MLPKYLSLQFNHINDIPTPLYQEILTKNHKEEGYMQEIYEEIYFQRNLCQTLKDTVKHHIIVLFDHEKEQLIGHGLLVNKTNSVAEMHVWVCDNFRHNGHGTKIGIELIKQAYVKQYTKVICYKTQSGSKLWNKIRKTLKEHDVYHLAKLVTVKKIIC